MSWGQLQWTAMQLLLGPERRSKLECLGMMLMVNDVQDPG